MYERLARPPFARPCDSVDCPMVHPMEAFTAVKAIVAQDGWLEPDSMDAVESMNRLARNALWRACVATEFSFGEEQWDELNDHEQGWDLPWQPPPEPGQLAQELAEALGAEVRYARLVEGDNGRVPDDNPTHVETTVGLHADPSEAAERIREVGEQLGYTVEIGEHISLVSNDSYLNIVVPTDSANPIVITIGSQ